MVRRARIRPSKEVRATHRQRVTKRATETRDAEASLEHARQLLKRYDLLELLLLCTRLSLFEAMTPPDSPLSASPILNLENTRIFSGLVLSSKAEFSGSRRLPSEREFIAILNDCRQVGYDRENSSRLKDANGTERASLEVQRIFAKICVGQIPLQDNLSAQRAGRLIAMLEILPVKFPERITANQRQDVQVVLSKMRAILGAVPSELFQVFKVLLAWLNELVYEPVKNAVYASVSTQPTVRPAGENRIHQTQIALSFLTPQAELDSLIAVNLEDFLSAFKRAAPVLSSTIEYSVRAFFTLTSRSIEELRELSRHADFKKGSPNVRLSPLDRYPIVRLDRPKESGPSFVVPNVRVLSRAFDHLIDFTLRESLGSTYDHARGALLHLYITRLVECQLPDLIAIPEIRYKSSTGNRESADLTIIDFAASRIIGIEIKGRTINLSTRVSLETEQITENLADVYSSLSRLPRKIADLRSGKPEFAQWTEVIKASCNFPSILVVVIREGLPVALPELLREHARLDDSHDLNKIQEPNCILSLDSFERAVELARIGSRPIGELLERHHYRSISRDYSAHHADAFEQDYKPLTDTFAFSFLPRISD